jgi:LuxR family maltose regulon positive regulatory protein
LRTATEGREPYPRAVSDLHVGLAELDRELDDLAGAEAHLETARAFGERAFITENRHRWSVAMAQVRAARGDYDTAVELLGQAEALYRHGFYPDIRPIEAMRARLRIAEGDLTTALGWAEDAGVTADDDPDYLREYEHLTLARLLLAQHRAAQRSGRAAPAVPVGAVLGLLERLHAAAAGTARDGSVLEIRMLQALAHHAQGDRPKALAALSRAVSEVPEPDSYVRTYLDEGPPMLALLRDAAASPEHAESVRRILQRAAPPVAKPEPHVLVDPLTQRELQVLRLLDSELTGPEIARELYVSLNTYRTHTKNIFTKLDVTTRAAAVRRAHERGLV